MVGDFREFRKSPSIFMDFIGFAAGRAAGRSSTKDFKAFWSWPSRAGIFSLYFSFTFSWFSLESYGILIFLIFLIFLPL